MRSSALRPRSPRRFSPPPTCAPPSAQTLRSPGTAHGRGWSGRADHGGREHDAHERPTATLVRAQRQWMFHRRHCVADAVVCTTAARACRSDCKNNGSIRLAQARHTDSIHGFAHTQLLAPTSPYLSSLPRFLRFVRFSRLPPLAARPTHRLRHHPHSVPPLSLRFAPLLLPPRATPPRQPLLRPRRARVRQPCLPVRRFFTKVFSSSCSHRISTLATPV